MTIGEIIKTNRKKMGLSQFELARKLNLALSSVRRYENGERIPKFSTLCEMSSFFGISLEEMEGTADVVILSERETTDEDVLLSNYKMLNKKGKSEALKRTKELLLIPEYTQSDNK